MTKIPDAVTRFLEKRGFVIVSTIDSRGRIHCAAKGIVRMDKKGKVYLLDLYKGQTFKNLCGNPAISITAIDERHFAGYTLQGKAAIVRQDIVEDDLAQWEDKIIGRISARVIDSVQREIKSSAHPEARLPQPKYLIVMEVVQIVDLKPPSVR